jgi:uncharacterized protein YdhG (YjbR/CyaY superfamily)
MAKAWESVAVYIAAQPAKSRRALTLVRSAIRNALPQAEEVISYKIPAYKLDGKIVIYFAAWSEHFSLYPAGSKELRRRFKKELADCEIGKGTIRFSLAAPVPTKLIARIAKFRAREVAEGKKGRKEI